MIISKKFGYVIAVNNLNMCMKNVWNFFWHVYTYAVYSLNEHSCKDEIRKIAINEIVQNLEIQN